MSRRKNIAGTAAALALAASTVSASAFAAAPAAGDMAPAGDSTPASSQAGGARSISLTHPGASDAARLASRPAHTTKSAARRHRAAGRGASSTPPQAATLAEASEAGDGPDTLSRPAAPSAIVVVVNGVVASDLDHGPVNRDGIMLIPLNGVLDRMAATVAWQPLTKTIYVYRGATHIEMQAGSTDAKVNGATQTLPAAPETLDGAIMVPLRFICDALGLQTTWDPTSRQINIRSLAPLSTPGDTAAIPAAAPTAAATTEGAAGVPAAPTSTGIPGATASAASSSGDPNASTAVVPDTAAAAAPPAGSTSPAVAAPANTTSANTAASSETPTATTPPAAPAAAPTTAPASTASPTPAAAPATLPATAPTTSPATPTAAPPSPETAAAPAGTTGSGTEAAAVAPTQAATADTTTPVVTPTVVTPTVTSPLPPALPPTGAAPAETSGASGVGPAVPTTAGLPPALPSAGTGSGALPPSLPTPSVGIAAAPAPPENIRGQLKSVVQKDDKTYFTVDTTEDATHYPLATDAILLGKETAHPRRQEVRLADVYPGDDVVLHLNARGEVELLETSYTVVRDTLRATADNRLLLGSGQVVTTAEGVSVTLPNGQPGKLGDLKPGQMMTFRINPTLGTVWHIDARPDAGLARPTPGNLKIDSISAARPGPYLAGDTIALTLQGTPGGKATFTIPGVESAVPMQETEPGVYHASLVAPPGITALSAPVIGDLTRNGDTAGEVRADTAVIVDTAPPTIDGITPAPLTTEANHQTAISAIFNDHGGTGVVPSSVHVRLNGLDVTDNAQITDRFVSCTGMSLPDGLNRASISVRDNAGNYQLKPWTFKVSTPGDPIRKVTFDGQHDRAGEKIKVALEGVQGGEATFDIGKQWTEQPLHETKPGHYEGFVLLERGDKAAGLPVVGHLRVGDQVYSRLSDELVVHIDGKPAAPTIDSPVNGSQFGPPLVVSGHATPGLRVHITVEYESRFLSMLGMRGFSSEQDAVADDTGVWRSSPLGLETLVPNARHIGYRIVCQAMNEAGAGSPKQTITVYRDGH